MSFDKNWLGTYKGLAVIGTGALLSAPDRTWLSTALCAFIDYAVDRWGLLPRVALNRTTGLIAAQHCIRSGYTKTMVVEPRYRHNKGAEYDAVRAQYRVLAPGAHNATVNGALMYEYAKYVQLRSVFAIIVLRRADSSVQYLRWALDGALPLYVVDLDNYSAGWVSRPYRPSNGTEGALFCDRYCARCELADENEGCGIRLASEANHIEDPEYPVQWVRNPLPKCTAFKAKQ